MQFVQYATRNLLSKLKVTEHMREHHTSFKFTCSFCKRKYDTYNGQVRHMKKLTWSYVIHVEIVEVSSSSNFSLDNT